MRPRSTRKLLALAAALLVIGASFTAILRAGDNLDVESGGTIHDIFWDSRLFDGTPGFPGAILWFHNPAGKPSSVNQTAFEARLENAFNTWDAVDNGVPGSALVPIVNFGGQTSAADPFALDGINTVAWRAGEFGGTLVAAPCWALNAPTRTIDDGAGHALMPVTGGPPIPFPGPPGVEYPTGTIIDCGMRFDSLDFWSTSDTPNLIQMDVQGVATHEAGHFIGLSHSTLGNFTAASTANATMLPFAAFQDMTFRTLEEDDKASVLRTYARNRTGGPIAQTVGGRGLIKLRLLQGDSCQAASGLSVVAYRTSAGINGAGRVETLSGSHLRAGLLDEPANGSAALNVVPLPEGESYTIYARTLEQGLGSLSALRYNYTTINSNVLDPESHSRTFDHLAVVDTLESGESVDLGDIGILGCWIPNPGSAVDLVSQSVTAPAQVFRGDQMAVASTFTNSGSAPSGAFSVGIYFSTDQTITSDDVFSGFACSVSNLDPGATGTCDASVTVTNVMPGDYYVGLLVDLQNRVSESIETNNGISTGHLTSVDTNPLDPIVNGSFETGDLTGWSVKELTPASNPSLPTSVRGAGVEYPAPTFTAFTYLLDYFTSAPTDGQWALLHDFNGNDPATTALVNRRELYQDLTLPVGATTLEFDYRAAWELFRFGATQPRTFSVEIEPAGGGAALLAQAILVAPINTIEEDTANPSGGVGEYPPGRVDISAFAGQSVRVKFVWNVPEPGTGFGFFQLDNIRVNANAGPSTPEVTWATPADITYGTLLGATELNATANVEGTFAYTPAAGALLPAGPHTLSVTFTPTDATSYSPVTTTVSLSVLKATPSITWPTPAPITFGTALGVGQLNATSPVAGSFSYTPAAGTVLNAGAQQSLHAAFTPTDTDNYEAAAAEVFIDVLRATPVVTWPTPADITAGTPLGAAHLNATANVPGTFAYTPPAGTVLAAGPNQPLSVLFTPLDTANHTSASAAVTINVVAATPPATAVTAPNGGERIFLNAATTIRWTATAATAIDVALSRNNGASYTPIAGCTALPGTAVSCPWTPSGTTSTTALIRVTATGAGGATAVDVSNAAFSIVSGTPAITVTAPNTAVTWAAGSSRTVTWSHNLGISTFVRLEVSRAGAGGPWEVIAPSVANATATTGTFPWIVSAPYTGAALLRVTSLDVPASDVSNIAFAIVAPSLILTAPNTNVAWSVDALRTVTWTHNLGTAESVRLAISRDGGTTWSDIAAGVPNSGNTSGSFSWTVNGPVTNSARIKATWVRDANVHDTSDVNFRVTSRVAVTAPNSAVVWAAGSTRTVTWTHNYGAAQVFDIDFSPDAGTTWTPLAANVPAASASTGTYTGRMPPAATTQGLMRVSPAGSPGDGDVSNVVFTLAVPSVTLTAPNTNVKWTIGQLRSINWTHNLGQAEQVTVEVSRDGGTTWATIAENVVNSTATSGTYPWTVTGPTTTAARVRVTWLADGTTADVSNVNFRVQ